MMTKWRSVVMAAAVALGLGFCSSAHASPIAYSYEGSPNFQIIHPTTGNGGVAFVGNSGSGASPGGGALGAMLWSVPSSAGIVGTFNNAAYTTGLTVTDTFSAASYTFNFSGAINGQLTSTINTLTNSFNTPTTLSHMIGSNMYTVTINPMATPGFGSPGAVFYNVSVGGGGGGGGVNPVPEPSTLLLSSLGLGCLGIVSWRRRRNAAALVSAAA
jgi:hypothetical protein